MKLIATLACRSNSSRLYGKPLQRLKNLTVLDYIIERLKERKEIADVVLAISETKENEVYVDLAKKYGIPFVFGDDKDVLGRLIAACDLVGGDTVFRITTEDPFHYFEGLPEAIKAHEERKADYTTYEGLPIGCSYEIINLDALKASHRDGEDRHRSELCALYINEHKDRFTHNILEIPKDLRRPHYRLTIDYPEDLIVCRQIAYCFGDDAYLPYEKLISFLDERPELIELVTDLEQKNPIGNTLRRCQGKENINRRLTQKKLRANA